MDNETPTTPSCTNPAVDPIVTASSASYDHEDFDPPSSGGGVKRKFKEERSGGNSIGHHEDDEPTGEERSQTIHRIKASDSGEGGKYDDALLLASLSDDVDAKKDESAGVDGNAPQAAAAKASKPSPQPVTPKEQNSAIANTTAETPRRSNVNAVSVQPLPPDNNRTFVLHPKPSTSPEERTSPTNPTKRYKEDNESAPMKKVTPERRTEEGAKHVKREPSDQNSAAPPPYPYGWGSPQRGYPQPPPPHHGYPYPYHPYPHYSPHGQPPGYYSRPPHPYPHPYPGAPAADPYQQPPPDTSAPEQREPTANSPLPYHPLSKSHVVPSQHPPPPRENDPYYRSYPQSYGYSQDYLYDARYARDPYYPSNPNSSSPERGQPYTVSMDENSPRIEYGLSHSPSRHGNQPPTPSSHPPPTPSGSGPPTAYSRENDYYDPHHPNPAVPPSGSFYQDSYYNSSHHHPPPPSVDPYEPHPHELPRREYSTPPPPHSGPYEHAPSWDAPVPMAVSQEGMSDAAQKKHQFRKGARGVHSEPVLLRKKFSWRNYPELEEYLIANRTEYLRHSALNYTAEQKHFNNRLTEGLLELAAKHNYVFDESCFNFVAVRDRIRCYYKSYVQSSKKRGVIVGFPKADHRSGAARGESEA
jgi:hypothetical protein